MSPHWCRVIDQKYLISSLPRPPPSARPSPPVPGGKMYLIIKPVKTRPSRPTKLITSTMKFIVVRFIPTLPLAKPVTGRPMPEQPATDINANETAREVKAKKNTPKVEKIDQIKYNRRRSLVCPSRNMAGKGLLRICKWKCWR